MREEELIEEGFERIDVTIEESGNEKDYYYYRYAFNNGYSMYSSESDNSPKNKWTISFDDFADNIVDIEDVQTIIALYKKWNKK